MTLSLRARTILGVALIEAVVLAILVITGVRYIERAQEQEIATRAETAVRLLSSTFKDPILSRDLATVNDTAETALQDSSILYVHVVNPEARVLASVAHRDLGALGQRALDRTLEDTGSDGVFDAMGTITVADEVIGTVRVGLDTSRTSEIVAAARRRALNIVAFEIALVALFSFILGTLLTRKLRGLEEAVDTVASGDFHARVPVTRDDEIGRVSASFNVMAERLGQARSRQAQTVSLLEALSHAQQLHMLGRSEEQVYEAIVTAVKAITGCDDCCIRHALHADCGSCDWHSAEGAVEGDAPEFPGRHVVSIPLRRGERELGSINLTRAGRELTEHDLAALKAVAPQIASLVEALEGRRELDRKDQLQRAILENVIDGIVSVGPDGRVLSSNPAFARMFGIDRERAVGRRVSDWLPDVPAEEYGGKVEAEARRDDGTVFSLELARTELVADGNAESLVVWVLGDISERKRVEREAVKAMEAAREAQRAKSAFLANMSHELRTPMNGVLGMLQLLQLDHLSSSQQGNVDTAVSAAEHLLEILDDVLVFSKAEAGKMALEALPVDLASMVEDSSRLLSHAAYEKGLELTCEVPVTDAGVLGDPTRIKQVIVNLVGNAIKFTEHGHVAVKLTCTGAAEGQRTFTLEVKDTGVGIAAEALPTLFSAFQQADTSTTRSFGGTGLGLSICRELISLMGGTLEVESRPGHGARFVAEFSLPEANVSAPLADLRGFQFALRGDLAQSLRVVRRYLVDLGAVEVPSAREAPGAAVILVNSGPSLERALAAMEGEPNRRIVVTEWSWISEHRGELGANLLAAPVARHELVEAVLSKKRQRESGLALVGYTGEVLLVEDNLVNQRVMQAMLKRLGVTCEIASNGALAVEVLKQRSFQLVLMDCQMPVMDGLEATRILRARGYEPPIIAVTANVLNEARSSCIEAGMDGFLSKPIKLGDLEAALKQHLDVAEPQGPSEDDAAGGAKLAH